MNGGKIAYSTVDSFNPLLTPPPADSQKGLEVKLKPFFLLVPTEYEHAKVLQWTVWHSRARWVDLLQLGFILSDQEAGPGVSKIIYTLSALLIYYLQRFFTHIHNNRTLLTDYCRLLQPRTQLSIRYLLDSVLTSKLLVRLQRGVTHWMTPLRLHANP